MNQPSSNTPSLVETTAYPLSIYYDAQMDALQTKITELKILVDGFTSSFGFSMSTAVLPNSLQRRLKTIPALLGTPQLEVITFGQRVRYVGSL